MRLPVSFWRFLACGAVFCAALAGTTAVAVAGDVFVPPPVPLNNDAPCDSGDDDHPRLLSDGAGRLLAVWYARHELPNTNGLYSWISFAWSDDGGSTWSDPGPLDRNGVRLDKEDLLGDVASLGNGQWYATWVAVPAMEEECCSSSWIARSIDNAETWSEPVMLPECARVTTDGCVTSLRVTYLPKPEKDSPFCDDGDIFVSRCLDGQTTWSDPTPVNNDAATDRCTGVIGEGWSDADRGPSMFYVSGVWIVVWERQKLDSSGQDTGADRLLAATSRDDGKTWSGPSDVPRPRLWEGGPRLQPDPPSQRPSVPIQFQAATPDRWHMLWWGSVDPSVDHDEGGLTASLTTDAGASWSSTLVFTDHGTDYYMPRDTHHGRTQFFEPTLTAGTSDDLLVTWSMARYVNEQFPDGYQVFAARSADHGRTWSEPVKISTDAASGPTWDDPSVSGDGGGRYVVVWPSIGDPNSSTDAGRILVAFSDDKGATWTDPTPFDSDAEGDAVVNISQARNILSIGPGQWLVAWSGSLGGDYGSDEDLLLTRLTYPDCNQNGVPDDVEPADGTAADADGNGVPDECDPGPEPNNPPDEEVQPGDGETPLEPGPALPCGIFPLVGVGLFLLVRSARTARGSPVRPPNRTRHASGGPRRPRPCGRGSDRRS